MKKFIAFPDIPQFRQIIQGLRRSDIFVGFDENNNPRYDVNIPSPARTFVGTVKLHGTNAGIVQWGDEIWCQSRTNIITPLKDNCGFAFQMSTTDAVNYFT